jgi:hypothetical protein
MESFTEIAIHMAALIARLENREVDSFSIDGVDTYTDEDGTEMIRIQASARVVPASDEIPFELPDRPEISQPGDPVAASP